jgi:hypothetical protein
LVFLILLVGPSFWSFCWNSCRSIPTIDAWVCLVAPLGPPPPHCGDVHDEWVSHPKFRNRPYTRRTVKRHRRLRIIGLGPNIGIERRWG